MLNKLVTTQKDVIKANILNEGKLKFADHVAALELEIKPIRFIYAQPDFAGAMKGKRTLASLHDAVDTTLAEAKIATDATAKDIRAKLAWCKEHAKDYGFLFMDLQQIISKQTDDFQLVVNTRIAEHKQTEAKKAQDAIDAAEKIRKAKEEDDAAAKVKADQDLAQKAIDDAARATTVAEVVSVEPVVAQAGTEVSELKNCEPLANIEPCNGYLRSFPTLTLGKIGTRLGFTLTADFLRTIGFEPAGRERAAVLYHDADFHAICNALIDHIGQARESNQQAA
jgi:hypothetical protein